MKFIWQNLEYILVLAVIVGVVRVIVSLGNMN